MADRHRIGASHDARGGKLRFDASEQVKTDSLQKIQDRLVILDYVTSVPLDLKTNADLRGYCRALEAIAKGWRYLATGRGNAASIIKELDRADWLASKMKKRIALGMDVFMFKQLTPSSSRQDVRSLVTQAAKENLLPSGTNIESVTRNYWRRLQQLAKRG